MLKAAEARLKEGVIGRALFQFGSVGQSLLSTSDHDPNHPSTDLASNPAAFPGSHFRPPYGVNTVHEAQILAHLILEAVQNVIRKEPGSVRELRHSDVTSFVRQS